MFAPLLRVPYPILLVLGGLGIGFIPGIPHISLRPDVVLVAILPPLLYSAAFFTSLRDLKRNARPLSLLSIGLVLTTTVSVAAVCHVAISGLSWPVCFVLGAVVAPTDAVAATAIASRLGLPRRLVTLLEGESLINDATALVAYGFAVTAVLTGSFSLWHAAWSFVVDVIGGIGIGLAVGFVIRQIRRRLDHSPTEIAIALAVGLFRLPARRGGRRLRRARRRHGRHLRRLVHARADHRPDTPPGRRGLGHHHLPPQRPRLRARRAPAAADPRLALRALDVLSHHRRADRQRRRHPHAALLDLPRHLRAALPLPSRSRARSLPALAVPDRDRLGRVARRRLARGRARSAAHHERRPFVSRS